MFNILRAHNRLPMSACEPLSQSAPALAPEGPAETSTTRGTKNPLEGLRHAHVSYGFIALLSLYLLAGQQAFFLSALITFTYPACVSVETCALTFLFLPQTQGAKLIYNAIEPLAKLVDDLMKKYSEGHSIMIRAINMQ
ncbi:hypothetical protein KIN20_008401 [Parelaphostrongylus tenuis]|uniref:Uncharacterized protein n=1 Tax=Parelaphostrongylus tenuis TaxID=148309 RepID=A0AAD5QHH3_PARTN|nr:hypothetical protein KIN20_008401 [Parelaphostrongylus tenuis]